MNPEQETYSVGNAELLKMFKCKTFDCSLARQIIENIPNLNKPILNLNGHSTTYLYEASENNNIEAVRLLLENGADPNLDFPNLINGSALYDLHFLWEEMEDEVQQRLEIVRMFFEFGANPNLLSEGETLYDHILWEVFNDSITPHDWEYLKKFFLILIAYGGGNEPSNYDLPNLTEPIDKNRISEYDFKLFLCEDGYHLEGHIIAPDGKDIGTV
ncbi:MAG: hypothetical protein J6L88_03075 [Clostridia bacterium]|nr:hypothetical protein [Clostridia bacterium]